MLGSDTPVPATLAAFKSFAWKCCATCNNWRGARRASSERDKVHYRGANDAGPCQGGGWSGTDRHPSDACSQWIRWTELQ